MSRYGSLWSTACPPSTRRASPTGSLQIDRDSLIDAARACVHPDALVVVVVADAAQVMESLKSLDWADPELIQE